MDGESVLGYIDSMTSFGIIAPQKRSLIVTNKRLLVVSTKSTSATASSAGFAYAFGIFGRAASNRINKEELEQAAAALSKENLDTLMQSDPDNVAIDNASVERVDIDRKSVTILANGRKTHYNLVNPDARRKDGGVYETYVEALQKALGDRVSSR